MANKEHNLEDIFREAFASHEMDVSAKVWSGIESTLGQAGAAASTGAAGSGFLAKAAAVIGFAGLITAATVAEIDYHSTAAEGEESTQQVVEDLDKTTSTESAVKLSEQEEIHVDPARVIVTRTSETIEGPSGESTDVNDANINQQTAPEQQDGGLNDAGAIAAQDQVQADDRADKVGGADDTANDSDQNVDDGSAVAQGSQDPSADRTQQPDPAVDENEVQASNTVYFSHNATLYLTPNNDGYNDRLEIDGYGFESFLITVWTRSGMEVFQAKNLEQAQAWDGKDKFGNPLAVGTYYYTINAVGTDGLPYKGKNAKGSIDLRR